MSIEVELCGGPADGSIEQVDDHSPTYFVKTSRYQPQTFLEILKYLIFKSEKKVAVYQIRRSDRKFYDYIKTASLEKVRDKYEI